MPAQSPAMTAEQASARASSDALLRAIFRHHARAGTMPPGFDARSFAATAATLGVTVTMPVSTPQGGSGA